MPRKHEHILLKADEDMKNRFFSRIRVPDENGCQDWLACVNGGNHGGPYGLFYPRARMALLAHRVSYIFAFGPIPDGMHCLHKCDRTICVAPEHLFLGTAKDNMCDMVAKKRNKCKPLPGELHPMAKLTEKDVKDIRSNTTLTNIALGKIYNISDSHISGIKKRKYWAHVQ